MELIDLINDLENFRNKGFRDCNVEKILLQLKRIENDKKVKIPEFVADWVEYCKCNNFTLFGCLDPVDDFGTLLDEEFEGDTRKCIRWCRKESDKVARAWLDGYEIEQEKRYLVEMKNLRALFCYLAYIPDEGYWSLMASGGESIIIKHTHKELEEAGFGDVFNSPLFEIEEVGE